MANYQNGQQYYGRSNSQSQYNHYGSYNPHLIPAGQDPSLRRTPSFDAGDDAAFFDDPTGHTTHSGAVYSGYNNGAGTGATNSMASQATGIPTQPLRMPSYSPSLSGYQHHPQPPASPQGPVAYNPSQYPRPTQPAYNPQQQYATLSHSYSNAAHRPYNPAAYQGTGQLSPTASTNPYGTSFPAQSMSSGPPLPPRPNDPDYQWRRQNSYSEYSSGSQPLPAPPIQPGSAPLPPRPSPYSPPLPNTPGAASFSSDEYLMNNGSQGRTYSQRASRSSHGEVQMPTVSEYTTNGQYSYGGTEMPRSSNTTPSEPGPTPPLHQYASTSPRRTDTLTRHPQSRPLPGPPQPESYGNDYFAGLNTAGNVAHEQKSDEIYDDLMKEVEAAMVDHRPGSSSNRRSPRAERHTSPSVIREEAEPRPLPSPDSYRKSLAPDETHTHTAVDELYSDDSDAEAAGGLAAMRMADEQDAADLANEDQNHRSYLGFYDSQYQQRDDIPDDPYDDYDLANTDLSLVGGGYDAHMTYGEDTNASLSGSYKDRSSQHYYDILDQFHSPHSPRGNTTFARVDTGGTGGLAAPSPRGRRMSFEDGDESGLTDDASTLRNTDDASTLRTSGSFMSGKDEIQEMFYHPGMGAQRPLPPAPVESLSQHRIPHLMPAGTYLERQGSAYGQAGYQAPDENLLPPHVPRSTSLSSHSSAPRAETPVRAKTDSDRTRLLKQQSGFKTDAIYETSAAQSSVTLDLPTLPTTKRKKFNPAKITTEQFKRCKEPWAMSSMLAWIKELSEDETDLKEHTIVEAIVALFTQKVPTMNTADAEVLGETVVKNMISVGAIVKDEEWVKFGIGEISGVIWQITGKGCYSSKLHDEEIPGRCYSFHCTRTEKKLDLSTLHPEHKAEDWITFYKLKKEDIEGRSKKEIERQNNLHEIVTTEDNYISQLEIVQKMYRDQLANMRNPVINPKTIKRFLVDVFGKVDAVKKVNEDHLLAQLKYRQKEQGPWIAGFSDIFREWIRKARAVYIDYAATFPNANYLVRKEAERNILFRQFLDQARENKIAGRLGWDTYLKAPITRIQRYTLLLQTVLKNMTTENEEKQKLSAAIDEIRTVALECDNKLGEMTKKVELTELGNKLKLRRGMEREVELNLGHLGREIVFRGDLLRAGQSRFQWVETHAILFDHYLVLAKPTVLRESMSGPKHEYFDISKVPIPMDLLVLESTNDDPVVKSSVKGIGAVTTTVNQRQVDPRLNRAATGLGGSPSPLSHTSTGLSANSGASSGRTVTSTVLEGSKDEKIMYPFRIKHLGKNDVYTLYAPTAANREDWCDKIIEAKTKHAAALFVQDAEPFKLRVLADSAFAYSEYSVGLTPITIRGTPLDRAIQNVDKNFSGQRPLPICRAVVNCATVFQQPYGKTMCAVGTDFGVYVSSYDDPRGWTRAIGIMRVTQIAVLEEFNLFLLISDKSLIAYHLDVVCPVSGSAPTPQNDSSRRAPQKLSGARDVGFFATGRMKDRALVFYKKREGLSSTFKVLEPILQKSTSHRARFLPGKRGQTEFFREFDEFYIPTDCYSIDLFHSSLAISTSRGVEVLTLDKKQPWSVPNLRSDQPEVQVHLSSIATRVQGLRPLGMFRLSESEFIVVYAECAVYVNKHGDVSRSVVMEFVGKASSACLYREYLILFNDDFVEIRNAVNGRMRQVISGRHVVCLDDGGNNQHSPNSAATTPNLTGGPASLGGGANGLGLQGLGVTAAAVRTVKFAMQHPEYEKSQIVLELVENERGKGLGSGSEGIGRK